MKSIKGRGRPIENDTPLIEYTQVFKDIKGEKETWKWNTLKSNGPVVIEFEDPRFNVSEKLLRELESLEKKYEPKKGERKPRVTKEDKLRMETIQKELEEFHYSLYPEDAPKIKKPKINGKIKKTKI